MNGLFGFFNGTYFVFCVIFMVNTKQISTSTFGEVINVIFFGFYGRGDPIFAPLTDFPGKKNADREQSTLVDAGND
jgi:hypothetical protein